MHKDVKQLVKRVKKQGFTVEPTERHQRVTNPDTGAFVVLPNTPSDWRWRENALSELRKIGFDKNR